MTELKMIKQADRSKKNRSGFVHALMIVNTMLIASSFPVGAAITHALPPALLMFFRFLLAVLLFSPFVWIKNGFQFPGIKNTANYIILSIPLVTFFWCMFESLRYTSLLNTGAMFTLFPAITAVLAIFINKDAMSLTRATGIFLGTMGAVWIIFRGDRHAFLNLDLNYGDIVFLIGCVALALYNTLVKRLYRNEPMELMTFWVLFWGTVWLFAIAWTDTDKIDWRSIDKTVFAGIAYLSFFTTLITFFLAQFSIVRIGAAKAAAYNFLTPVFVIGLSVILRMEEFIPATLPGILLVVCGMLLIQLETSSQA